MSEEKPDVLALWESSGITDPEDLARHAWASFQHLLELRSATRTYINKYGEEKSTQDNDAQRKACVDVINVVHKLVGLGVGDKRGESGPKSPVYNILIGGRPLGELPEKRVNGVAVEKVDEG